MRVIDRDKTGKKLMDMIKEKKLTVEDLERITGASPSTINNWLKTNRMPKDNYFLVLVYALGYPFEDVVVLLPESQWK